MSTTFINSFAGNLNGESGNDGWGGGGGGAGVVEINDISLFGNGGASASVRIDADGFVYELAPSSGALNSSTDWILPRSAAPDDYQVKADLTLGTVDSGITGSWIDISTSPVWTVSPEALTIMTISIRKGTGPVLDTAQFTLASTAGGGP